MHSLPGGTPQITSIVRPDFHVEFQAGISGKRNKSGGPDQLESLMTKPNSQVFINDKQANVQQAG
jgi:hypothetical protein